VIGLQFNYEKEYTEEYEVEYEAFPDPEPAPVVERNDDDEPVDDIPIADEEEKKEPAFKVEDYRWTVTDRKPKNLPQLFMQSKGINA
jgi:hypothetical protein